MTLIQNQWGERTSITWDPLDREQRWVFGNGMSTSHVYDAAGRETGLRTVDSAGNDLQRYTATYDAVGNRLTVQELDGTLVTYGYDTAYQLTSEQRDRAQAYDKYYEYDPVGNRQRNGDNVAGTVVTSTYNAANELTTQEEKGGARTTFAYDRNGNTLSEDRLGQVTNYTWDYENRMLGQVEPDGSRYTYTYRQDSRRYRNETPEGSIRIYTWDELNCFQEVDQTYSLIAQYTDYPGQWGGLASQRRGVDSSYYGFDLQWTGRVLVAQSQLISDTYVNDAWGVELASTGSTWNVYRYVGQWGYGRETSKRSDVWQRQLQRDWGRWLSKDPLWKVSLEQYTYVKSWALIAIDPWGLNNVKPKGQPCPPGYQIIPSPTFCCPDYEVSSDCQDVCEEAYRRRFFPPNIDLTTYSGMNVCDGKRKCACTFVEPDPNGCGVDECLMLHELRHCSQTGWKCKDCGGLFVPLTDPVQSAIHECEARRTELACLLAKGLTAKNSGCSSFITSSITYVITQLRNGRCSLV